MNDTYSKFIDALHVELEEMDAQHQKQVAANNAAASFSANLVDAPFDPNAPPPGMGMATPPPTSTNQPTQLELLIADRRQELGIFWIQYMRFARRTGGLRPAREVFSQARKDRKWVTWEVFEAAGTYHVYTFFSYCLAGAYAPLQ